MRDREEGRMACYHGVQSKTSFSQPIHQLPATKFCLPHSAFSSAFCLSPRICHRCGGSNTAGCEKMMALTFYWQKVYIHYSSINTMALQAAAQPLLHLNAACVCLWRRASIWECVFTCWSCVSGLQLSLTAHISIRATFIQPRR